MIIYLAGPLTQINNKSVQDNVSSAKAIALELWKLGYTVISPHANCDLPMALAQEELEPSYWLNKDLEIISRCDALVVLPDWELSLGTNAEINYAKERDIPITFYPELPEISRTELLRPMQINGYIDIIMRGYRIHLAKNCDYSPSNILGTGEIGIVTRIWDKVARLLNLVGFNVEISKSEYDKPKVAKNESLDDNLIDLSVYSIIWQLYRHNIWGK